MQDSDINSVEESADQPLIQKNTITLSMRTLSADGKKLSLNKRIERMK